MRNKKGSAGVLMALLTISLSTAILSSILVIRNLVINSESRTFGQVWTKAILSEYDKHLFQDYRLLAFLGNNTQVAKRIAYYQSYSMAGKMNIQLKNISAELNGYEMSDPDNFREAMDNSFGTEAIESLLKKEKRANRNNVKLSADGSKFDDAKAASSEKNASTSKAERTREIRNPWVVRTLPSHGEESGTEVSNVIETLKKQQGSNSIKDFLKNASSEILFIRKYFNSALMIADKKKHYFRNEWEYLVKGSMNDVTNLKSCRRRIFLIRNGMNLFYLYKDPAKVELVTSVAEIITPGPLGVATQAILMEAWAALESEQDVQDLLNGERVPIMKTADTWKTGLESVLNDNSMKEKLDEESQKMLQEKEGEIQESIGETAQKTVTEGLTYEDYLMILILATNSETRTLRVMDLVQINMKYRYYRDFNLAEYYGGVSFTMNVNGKKFSFEKEYQ